MVQTRGIGRPAHHSVLFAYADLLMSRSAKVLSFALDLLHHHPQIHFQDAKRAAQAYGLDLSRATFYKATKALRIKRKRGRAAEGPALADRPQSPTDSLVLQLLEKFRAGQEEVRRFRKALEQIRDVVRQALVEDGAAE